MAEQPPPNEDDFDNEETPGYKAPALKSLDEIRGIDKDDASLESYKKKLLGDTANTIFWPDDPRKVIVKSMSLVVEGRDDITINLEGDLSGLKKKPLVIKEDCEYKVKISFNVQREIVSGLKLVMKSFRKGVRVDIQKLMCGSYAPREKVHDFTTPKETAPSGMLSRGTYVVKSEFSDDDKNKYLEWEWAIDIKKDWE